MCTRQPLDLTKLPALWRGSFSEVVEYMLLPSALLQRYITFSHVTINQFMCSVILLQGTYQGQSMDNEWESTHPKHSMLKGIQQQNTKEIAI